MKKKLFPIVCLSFSLPAFGLAPGDAVTPDSLAKAEVVQGELPKSWKEGDLYILECWATWCGPCVAAIPHVDELYDKYSSKGLHVIGMNVWEDGKDKVVQFVEKKGDGMSYPVAYVGKGGEFEETWLKAGGVRGIPHAFVVKNGKLLFSTHPASLKEEMIEGLLAGGDQETAVIEKIASAEKNKEAIGQQMRAFSKASMEKDPAEMAAVIAAVEKIDPDYSSLGRMRFDHACVSKDWAKAQELLSAMPDPRMARGCAFQALRGIDADPDDVPVAFQEKLLETVEVSDVPDPVAMALVARTQWRLGKKDEALATANKAASLDGRMPKEPFVAFAASFGEGKEPMTLQELFKSLQAAMRPNSAPKP